MGHASAGLNALQVAVLGNLRVEAQPDDTSGAASAPASLCGPKCTMPQSYQAAGRYLSPFGRFCDKTIGCFGGTVRQLLRVGRVVALSGLRDFLS